MGEILFRVELSNQFRYDKVHNRIRQYGHNKPYNSVENGVFGGFYMSGFAIGGNIADTTDDDHEDGDRP